MAGRIGRVRGGSPWRLPFEKRSFNLTISADDCEFIDGLAAKHNIARCQVIRFMIQNERRRIEAGEKR